MSEVRLTEAEREVLAKAMDPYLILGAESRAVFAVEAILAARMAAVEALADAIEADDDIAMNIVLGGPSYVTYWLRERAALAATPPPARTETSGGGEVGS